MSKNRSVSEFGVLGELLVVHTGWAGPYIRGERGERLGWAEEDMKAFGCHDGRWWKVLTRPLSCFLLEAEAYVSGMLFCLGIFLSFYLLTVLLACWENWR